MAYMFWQEYYEGINIFFFKEYPKKIAGVDEEVEKRELSCTVGGRINWCSHYEKHYGDSSKS